MVSLCSSSSRIICACGDMREREEKTFLHSCRDNETNIIRTFLKNFIGEESASCLI